MLSPLCTTSGEACRLRRDGRTCRWGQETSSDSVRWENRRQQQQRECVAAAFLSTPATDDARPRTWACQLTATGRVWSRSIASIACLSVFGVVVAGIAGDLIGDDVVYEAPSRFHPGLAQEEEVVAHARALRRCKHFGSPSDCLTLDFLLLSRRRGVAASPTASLHGAALGYTLHASTGL